MSSWKLPNLRNTWQNVTDKADEEENVNKVTLPVGIVIGVIGILVASWLIWCVLGGCDSVNTSSQQTSMAATSSYPLRSRPTRPAPRPPKLQTSMVVESSRTETTAPRPLKVSTPLIPVETADQRLFGEIKRVNEPTLVPGVGVAQLVPSSKTSSDLLAAAKKVGIAVETLVKDVQKDQKGGGNNLTGMPLIVIIIMMLVVRAKLTDRR